MTTLLTSTFASVLQSGWLGRAAELVRWLVVAGIAYTLATTVLYFMADPAHATVSDRVPAATEPALQEAAFDLAAVQARQLFGKASAVVATEPKDEPIVETRLPLELHGVFVADVADDSAAIVAPKNKTGKLYTVGEKVPGNATLIEVHADHIVLRRAGARETLRFFNSNGGFVAEHDEPAATPSSDRNSSVRTPPPVTPSQRSPRTAKEFVEIYRDRLTDNPGELLKELGVAPVSTDGGQGYRLGNLASSPYLSRTGLQPGDVVLSVNGRPVGDVNRDKMELDSVLAQGSARLEVQRGSRRFYVTASLK